MLRHIIAEMQAAGKIHIVQQITAKARKCPECGNTEFALMPTDFETAKCTACGKIMDAGGPGSGRHHELWSVHPQKGLLRVKGDVGISHAEWYEKKGFEQISYEASADVEAYSEDEERDSSGKWTKGGDGESKKPLDKSALAKLNYKPSTKAKQAVADKSEEVVSKALGLPRTKNNSAFDLQSPKVGVEIKTLVDNKNDKITMHPESRRRKEAEAAAKGLRMYTVVVDKRGRSAGYYYSKGVGAFRISSMARVDNLAGLRMAIR